MGVGHLDIGLNKGGAQVFGHNPAVAQFANILQQQKAKQDADNKYLAETLAQAKPEGLRNDADRELFYKQYNELKNQGIAANAQTDKLKKAMAIANVKQGIMDLNGFVDKSKKLGAMYNQVGQAYMQSPDNFDDATVDKLRKMQQLPSNHPEIISDITQFAHQPDLQKLDTRLKHIRDNELLSGIPGQNVITGRQKVGNKWENTIQPKYTADPSDVAHAYLNEFDINKTFRNDLRHKYGQSLPQTLSPDGQKAALVDAYIKNELGGEVSKYGPVKDVTDFRPRAPVTNVYVGGQPSPLAIPAENEEGKKIGTFSSPNYLPMNHSGINMAGVPAINMQTLQPEQPLKSSSKYNLVGLTSAPVLNKDLFVGNKKIPKGSLSQGDYAKKHPEDVTWKDMAHMQEDYPADDEHPKAYTVDHLVDSKLLPHNVTGTKAFRGETANFKSYNPGSGAGQQMKPQGSYQHTQTAKDANGKVFTLGYKNGKWYDTKTNKEWGQ